MANGFISNDVCEAVARRCNKAIPAEGDASSVEAGPQRRCQSSSTMAKIAAAWPLGVLLLLAAILPCCAGFGFRPFSRTRNLWVATCRGADTTRASHRLQRRYLTGGDDDGGENAADDNEKGADDADAVEDDGRDAYTWAELQADPELSKMEFDSSMNRKNAMLLPQRISQAVTVLAWSFVIGGIILNSLGYAWVRDPAGGIGVGTVDERNFQREVMRERRREPEEESKPTSSSSVGVNDERLAVWVEQQHTRQSG
ncbi:hypothetical protein ACHAWF_015782 [Thalassiosira exigua]